MHSSVASSLILAAQQATIYFGIPILIAGVTGNFLNLVVFLSLRTFRQSSCAFYLTIMSFLNIGQLISGLLTRIIINGYRNDWINSSAFYCKFRLYSLIVTALISLTCMCLATIDQYLATCPRTRWQRWSHIKVAHKVTVISVLIWILYGIPFLIYNNLIYSPITNRMICITSMTTFYYYYAYSFVWIFGGMLPIFVNALFGLLAYCNVQQMHRRTVPLIRRELDKQLTVIVLIQVVYTFVAIIPYIIVTIIILDSMSGNDDLWQAKIQLATSITTCLYYLYFSVSFEIQFQD
ncbi:unnamed protein product [Adineta ricciae]|uniref:G-protein coupled receptors family 1 profile domain-containing protein n=1 Tax=Adineta ricciae TaxID=249248 RepID=A0A814HZU0_ADIRI|nr:unnamed protein product [Adineta ricciae]